MNVNSVIVRKLLRRPLYGLARRAALLYLCSERHYAFEGLELTIPPGVFHPGLFFTTGFLIDALREYALEGRTVLELGAGSGLISLWSAARGGVVTATDVSPLAVAALEANVRNNLPRLAAAAGGPPRVLQADMFDGIPRRTFDFVIINPPFYPRDPRTDAERAWFCGRDFGYFEKLLAQIGGYLGPGTRALMALSEDCDITRIAGIARRNQLGLRLEKRKRFFLEDEFIFSIRPS